MKSFDDFKADVYARRDNIIKARRRRKRIILTCVPVFLCVVLAGIFVKENFFITKESNTAARDYDEYLEETIDDIGVDDYDKANGGTSPETDDGADGKFKDRVSSTIGYATSQVENAAAPNGTASTVTATDSVSSEDYSYSSTMSARVEVSDGYVAEMCLLDTEQEAKTILQLITLSGAIDEDLEPPIERVTVYLREYDKITIYYYQGDSDEEPPEGAVVISAQVADGILKYLEERQ